jgi:hypothetical protein
MSPVADTPLAEAYGDRLELVARTAAVAAVRTWRPEGLWISAAGAAIRGGQAVGVELARQHAALALERAGSENGGNNIPANVTSAIGLLSSGLVLERALASVAVHIAAAAPADRANVARTGIARIAHSATYDASRAVLHELIQAGPFSGWRWLSRGTCAACLARDDGNDKPDGTAMRVHPSCRCVAEPSVLDPLEDRLTPEGGELPDGTDWEPREVAGRVSQRTDSAYTGSGRAWNESLRAGDGELVNGPTAPLYEELRAATATEFPAPVNVYRGAVVDAETFGKMQPGATISDAGFWSTTPEPWIAGEAVASLEQAEGVAVLFEIVAKRGAALANEYREVVLPAGGRYRVVRVLNDVDIGGDTADIVVQVIQV